MPIRTDVDCAKCRHFYVTWDPHFPKGCKVFGFKSKQLPSHTVYEATGKFCEEFAEKTKPREKGGARP
jgi:hypothetical protein